MLFLSLKGIAAVTQMPVIVCPSNISTNVAAGTCGAVVNFVTPSGTSESPGATTVQISGLPSGSVFPVGVTSNVFEVTDISGNKTNCSFTVTVVDNIPPTFTAPGNITIYSDNTCNYNASPSITGRPNNEADNCPLGAIKATYTDGVRTFGSCAGTSTVIRTWSLSDVSNNTTTHQQTITIADNIKPVITLPPNTTVECSASVLPAATGTATATDNCSAAITINYTDVLVPGNCSGRSTITRTWTATDCSGNSSSGNQTINIQDTQPPILTCTSFTVANPDAIPASDAFMNVTATDNCGGAVEIILTNEEYSGLSGAPGFCPSSVTRKYIARDLCGNTSAECTQVITVSDHSGCAVCQSSVPFFPVILSGAPDSLWTSPSVKRSGLCCPDPEKNARCVSFNVYLDKDAVGLIFDINSGAIPPGALYYQVDCGPQTAVGEAICLAGGRFYTITFCKPGNNENTYSIQSISGITGVTGLITRQDAKCADRLTVSGVIPSTVTWRVKSPNDQTLLRYLSCTNCMDPIFTPDKSTPPSIVYEVCGTLPGTNQCGNSPMTDCKDVTVTTLPAITIAFDINLGNICANNIPTINATVSPVSPYYNYQWYDAPNGTGTLLSTNPSWKPAAEGSYSLVVTETKSAVRCNSATYNFNIVFDVLKPTILAPPAPLIVECSNPGTNQQIVDWLSTASATDGVNSIPVTNNYNGITMAGNQSVNVVFSASDPCGNISTTTSTITVIDTLVPTIICPQDVVQTALPGNCSLNNVVIPDPVTTDNCGIALKTWTIKNPDNTIRNSPATGINSASGQTFDVGVSVVTYTVADAAGNKASCQFNVWIKDLIKPVFSTGCPADVTTTADPGLCTAYVSIPAPAISELCNEGYSVVNSFNNTNNASGNYPVGVTVVNWTITDNSGNVTTCSQTVTVNDLPPTLVCPGNILVQADFGLPYKDNVSVPVPTYSDNCSGLLLTWAIVHPDGTTAVGTGALSGINIYPGFGRFYVGVTTITYTLTDANAHTAICSFTVTVEPKPEISCAAGLSTDADTGICSATIDPGFPIRISGSEPITYTWVMSGTTTGSGTGAINNHIFNMGTTTIIWTATNVSGTATCSQSVTVTDHQLPDFTPPPALSECVEKVNTASVNIASMDINPDRPEYYTLVAGNTLLDIDPLTFTDNCSLSCPVEIRWKIDMSDGSRIPALPIPFQTGQPSTFGSPIRFAGDGLNFVPVNHTITYWIVDCAGNVSDPQTRKITIVPRPNIIKGN